MMVRVLLTLLLGFGAGPLLAAPPQVEGEQPATTTAPDAPAPEGRADVPDERRADAYYEFMRGLRLEGRGESAAAAAAYQRALESDPDSAEIRATLAGLYARERRLDEAVAIAREALTLEPDNVAAHLVLGMVFSALSQDDGDPEAAENRALAITHLERALADQPGELGLALTLGRLYVENREYPRAIERLEGVVEEAPMATEAVYLLAEAQAASGAPQTAIRTLQDGLRIQPDFYRGWVALAELLEQDRRWTEAAEAYAKAASLGSVGFRVPLRRARALSAAGEREAARDVLADLAEEYPTEPAVLYALSEEQRDLGDLDAALATAERLRGLDPDSLRGAYAVALVHEERRDYAEVVSTLDPVVDRALERRPLSAALLPLQLHLGTAYQELGEFDEAIATFERALESPGGEPAVRVSLVQVNLAAGRAARAVEVAAEAVEKYPDDTRFVRLQARALHEDGREDDAIETLSAAIDRRPDDVGLHLTLAGLYSESGQIDEGVALLDRAAGRFPDEVTVPFQLGAVLETAERYDEAEQAFRRALELDPEHAPTLNYLGYMFADRGVRLDEAVDLLKRAVAQEPDNGSYLDSLGWAYYQLDRLEEARTYLSRAADLLQRNSVVQDHFGDLLARLDDTEGAVDAWRRALEGDGTGIDRDTIERKIERATRR